MSFNGEKICIFGHFTLLKLEPHFSGITSWLTIVVLKNFGIIIPVSLNDLLLLKYICNHCVWVFVTNGYGDCSLLNSMQFLHLSSGMNECLLFDKVRIVI